MSRDGLLPKIFSSIHPRFRTPWFSTILTGFMVAIPALFMNLTEVTDLSVIGTLFAFAIVCAGVLVKDKEFAGQKRFVPYINSRYIAPGHFPLIAGSADVLQRRGHHQTSLPTSRRRRRISRTALTTSSRVFLERLPYFVFIIFSVVMTVLCIDQTALAHPGPRRDVLHVFDDRARLDELGPLRDLAARGVCHLFLLQLHAQQAAHG